MANTNLYPNKSGLGLMEPVALPGHNVAILFGNTWMYKKVNWFESIPFFQFLNIGALAAGTPSALTQAPNLEAKDDHFAQIRWYPEDNAEVRAFLPAGVARYSLRNVDVPIDPQILFRDPCLHLTELIIWQNNRPAFVAVNGMDYALTQVRLVGGGFHFNTSVLDSASIKRIETGHEPCTYLTAQGAGGKEIRYTRPGGNQGGTGSVLN